MKFEVKPIINEIPSSVKPFRELYSNGYAAKLAYKRSKWVFARTRLAEAQNWKCCFCGCYMTEVAGVKNSVTVEHVVPKSMGGTDDMANLAASCYRCNKNRGTKDINEFCPSKVDTDEKSKALVRIEAKVRKYLKKAEKFAEVDFKVNETIQSFDDWFSTLPLCRRGKQMFFAQYKLFPIDSIVEKKR